MIKELLARMNERKRMKQEYEDEDRVVHGIQEKKKSGNERELEKYMHEEREKMILARLKKIRKKRNDEYWHHSTILNNNKALIKSPNIFKHKKLFKGGGNILK